MFIYYYWNIQGSHFDLKPPRTSAFQCVCESIYKDGKLMRKLPTPEWAALPHGGGPTLNTKARGRKPAELQHLLLPEIQGELAHAPNAELSLPRRTSSFQTVSQNTLFLP